MANKRRLIPLDELLKFPIRIDHYDKVNGNEHFVFGVEAVLEYAEYLPIVEETHGRWLEGNSRQPCSVCRYRGMKSWKFCPNCGAKMDLPRITDQAKAALEAMGRKAHKEEEASATE